MKGRSNAAQHQREVELSLAYNTAAMTAAAGVGKLKKFEHYLARAKPQKAQAGAQMIANLQELKARGAPMTIRKR